MGWWLVGWLCRVVQCTEPFLFVASSLGTELSLSDSKLRKQHRNEVTNNTLLQSIRETASAAGGGGSGSAGTTVHPDIKALKAKIKAQQDEMEALNKFLSRRK